MENKKQNSVKKKKWETLTITIIDYGSLNGYGPGGLHKAKITNTQPSPHGHGAYYLYTNGGLHYTVARR